MSGKDLLLLGGGPSGPPQYQIERSLRFNSADTAYLNRTPSAGNRKTWTFSAWLKITVFSTQRIILEASDGSNYTTIYLDSSDVLALYRDFGTSQYINTSQVLRDPSAWYHIIVAVDTTQATASNRVKMYLNGSQITNFSSATYPAQDALYMINANCAHGLGARIYGSAVPFNGYMTEINFIDGQQLTPSSFGETNTVTGVWQPKQFTGTYGTNGYFLQFADNSGTTSTTLGKDTSGNGNNWTPNNFSVTAGIGNDSLVDTPTPYGTDTGAGGEVRGNYCTINPLMPNVQSKSNGNLDIANDNAVWSTAPGTMVMPSGKWYFEATANATWNFGMVGVLKASSTFYSTFVGEVGWAYQNDGRIWDNNANTNTGVTIASGNVISVAVDIDAGKIWFAKNGTWLSSGNPAAGTNSTFSNLSGAMTVGVSVYNNGSGYSLNFGQRAFAYTAPSGFKALVTQNLSTPTVVQGDDYFNTVLYTGTSASQSVTGVGFQPDFVWIKNKSNSTGFNHVLQDSVRGFTTGKKLASNLSTAENGTNITDDFGYVSGVTSDGFDLNKSGTGSYDWLQTNASSNTYVAWNWKANGAGSSNTQGTITSTVSVNTTAGFSVVTYTGTGSNATVGHGLGATPGMIIIKCRNNAYNWAVWQTTLGGGDFALQLNTTIAKTNAFDYWNGDPNSTIFTLGTDNGVNQNGATYVAYVFAPITGFSAFGSYTGNGSADGPFVYTGFRPRWVMFKRTDTANDWFILDTARDTYNAMTNYLSPDLASAEATASNIADFVSNGVKVRGTSTYFGFNANGGTYIYAAFAENPFKYALAR